MDDDPQYVIGSCGRGERFLRRGNRVVPSLSGTGLMRGVPGSDNVVVPEWVYVVAVATHRVTLTEEERSAVLAELRAREDVRALLLSTWLLHPLLSAGRAAREVLRGEVGHLCARWELYDRDDA